MWLPASTALRSEPSTGEDKDDAQQDHSLGKAVQSGIEHRPEAADAPGLAGQSAVEDVHQACHQHADAAPQKVVGREPAPPPRRSVKNQTR